jgi:hypothetical protein
VFVHLGDWGESGSSNIVKFDPKKDNTIVINLKQNNPLVIKEYN